MGKSSNGELNNDRLEIYIRNENNYSMYYFSVFVVFFMIKKALRAVLLF